MKAMLGDIISKFLGGMDGLLCVLITFMVLDCISEILVACIRHELTLETLFKLMAKKIALFTLVGMANIIDTALLSQGDPLRTAVLLPLCSSEGLHCLINANILGAPIPASLLRILRQMEDKGDQKDYVGSETTVIEEGSYVCSQQILQHNNCNEKNEHNNGEAG